MKYSWILMLVLLACNAADEEENVTEVEEVTVLSPDEMFAYSIQPDSQVVMKNAALPEAYMQEDSLLKGLNHQYPDIILEKVKRSNDTLYTRIANAEHLTQRMGSAGPELYFANMYFNLTAVPGIRYVRVDFEEGDHAQPGVFGPDNFQDYRIVSSE